MVAPDVAYFGQKDAQQALVIRRLVRDLDIPVRIAVCPTVRESDGLAMSSRNAHLSASERERATALRGALESAATAVAGGERDPATVAAIARAALQEAEIEPEYLELVDADSLEPVATISGNVIAVIAARIGTTRLIDNQPLSTVFETAGSTDNNGGF
jgi:pantoate--beta-alanine ligase